MSMIFLALRSLSCPYDNQCHARDTLGVHRREAERKGQGKKERALCCSTGMYNELGREKVKLWSLLQ